MSFGGGKMGSIATLKAFSTIAGMILAKRGQESYKQGLVLTSMSQVLKLSSIMKSSPNISKENSLCLESMTR
jgi:hypothetical protein